MMLGDAPSGRLYKALVDTKKAASVAMFSEPERDPGLAVAYADVAPRKIRGGRARYDGRHD